MNTQTLSFNESKRIACLSIDEMYDAIDKQLSLDWKSYSFTFGKRTYDVNADFPKRKKKYVIKKLLKMSFCSYIDNIGNHEYRGNPFFCITVLFIGEKKESHQFQLIKETTVDDPEELKSFNAHAKPLNYESQVVKNQLYVQEDKKRYAETGEIENDFSTPDKLD